MERTASMSKWRRVRLAFGVGAGAIGMAATAYGQTPAPVKIALPVFLSGPAVGPFGEPSRKRGPWRTCCNAASALSSSRCVSPG